MINSRKLIGAAAFSVALAGGGVAGALLGTPGTSGAQDGTTSTTVAPADGTAKPGHPGGPGGPLREARGEGLDAAAKALGITRAELLTELKAGKSIADVAKEKDVPVQTVIDAMVAEGKTRLEAAIAALPDRVTTAVNRQGLPQRPDGPRGGDHGPRPDDDATTSTTTAAN
jgi:hypothetical protein